MRHQDMRGIAAVDGDAEVMMIGAQILVAGAAGGACAAADPWIDRDAMADHRAVGRVAGGFNSAGDLMAERERQRAVFGDVELLAAAQIEIAVLDVQVGMADAATFHAHQNFAAARGRAIRDGLAQRLTIGDERLAMKFAH